MTDATEQIDQQTEEEKARLAAEEEQARFEICLRSCRTAHTTSTVAELVDFLIESDCAKEHDRKDLMTKEVDILREALCNCQCKASRLSDLTKDPADVGKKGKGAGAPALTPKPFSKKPG